MSESRRPRPATQSTALPTLGAALAAAAAQGCEAPACGDTRADEVRAHGPRAVDEGRRGRGEAMLREVAIAVGLRAHRGTRPDGPELTPAGAAPVHTPEPRVTAGEAAPVTPTPVRPVDVDGGIRAVDPTPPAPPPPRVRPRPQVSGGARAVTPHDRDRHGGF
jgi:hypothetical protein